MITPTGYKKLWKNIRWENDDEKRAFFNKYFRDSVFVSEQKRKAVSFFKEDVLRFMEKHKITKRDVVNFIKGK